MTPRPHLLSLSLAALLLPAAGPAAAQRVVDNTCHANGSGLISEYGRAVSVGAAATEVLIGAPGANDVFGCNCPTGAVFVRTGTAVYGDDQDDRLGASVAAGLNLDGDALADGVAGAPGDDDSGAEAGSVRAIDASGAVLYTVHGDAAGDGFGTSLAALGDLDGDGLDEFLVGAPQKGAGAGYARVLSGADGATVRTHPGSAVGDRFGLGLTGLPDLDGDGVGEYAVGAPGEGGVGRVWVYSGAGGAVLRTHDGKSAGDELGYALGAGSDLDRDGVDELLAGAPRGGLAIGSAYAFSGVDGSELASFDGTSPGGWFGGALAGTRDFDGDGHGDLVVGEPDGDPQRGPGLGGGAGRATVFSGASGAILARLGGGAGGAQVGISVSGGADFDGDGLSDALIGGVLNNDGYGDNSCATGIGRALDQRVDRGPDEPARYGSALASIGDLDGDGARELLIGAPGARDPGGQVTGMARLVSGRTGATLRELYGAFDGDYFGQAVANAGDVDRDGKDDLLIGSADVRSLGFVPGVGYAEVYSGATGALLHHFPSPSISARYFGGAVAGEGDLDGDGHADVIVGGARLQLQSGFGSDGYVRAYSGQTGAELHAFDGPAGLQEALGASVSLIDDLDGDGLDDFLFGIPQRFVSTPFAFGVVELRSGLDGALLDTVSSTFGLRNGVALARLGDLNSDGYEDFAFSSWDPQFLWSSGSVHAISGQDSSELWMADGQTPYQGLTFGFALADAGDRNGDGTSDLAVGIPGVIDFHAQSLGAVSVLSGANGSAFNYQAGYAGWDYFGYSVAGLGDVNGDGLPELAIGAPTEPANGQGGSAGWNRVHVQMSNHLRQHDHCPLSTNSTGGPATIAASGLGSLALNDVTLEVVGAPSGRWGAFLMGSDPGLKTFGHGYDCLFGTVKRLSKPLRTSPAGSASFDIDFTAHPANQMLAGSSWSFQFLFRDQGSIDTSDAVRIDVLP